MHIYLYTTERKHTQIQLFNERMIKQASFFVKYKLFEIKILILKKKKQIWYNSAKTIYDAPTIWSIHKNRKLITFAHCSGP